MIASEWRRCARAGVLWLAACSPAANAPSPSLPPPVVAAIDAGAAPADATPRIVYGVVYPPDAAAPLPESITRPDAAVAPAPATPLSPCSDVPKRSARSDAPRHGRGARPRDLLGKTEAQIAAIYGEPWCGTRTIKQWPIPRGCTDWRQRITVWFKAGKASHVVAKGEWTGEYCDFAP